MCRSYADIRPLSHELTAVNIWISHHAGRGQIESSCSVASSGGVQFQHEKTKEVTEIRRETLPFGIPYDSMYCHMSATRHEVYSNLQISVTV
jgi:hypothetical protein